MQTVAALLSPLTYAVSHVTYIVSDDLSNESTVVHVIAGPSSRFLAELFGTDDLDSFDLTITLAAPIGSEVSCDPAF